jgi:linearmycin/streptolysin S transport system ATP-binding protein
MPPATTRAERRLEAHGISKFFGDLTALRDVQLCIEPGDSVLLYGPNGAGKTTLLRILAALARPNEGYVSFAGHKLSDDSQMAKAAIGFVSHATLLYAELTGRENLWFYGRLFGLRNLESRIDRALDLFDVRHRADELVRTLSRGLQQRVSLARALLHDPEFLLLDEPFTGLDAEASRNLQSLLARLPEDGKGLVFSTHDFEQGASIAHRLVALEKGKIRYDGPLRLAPPALVGQAVERTG